MSGGKEPKGLPEVRISPDTMERILRDSAGTPADLAAKLQPGDAPEFAAAARDLLQHEATPLGNTLGHPLPTVKYPHDFLTMVAHEAGPGITPSHIITRELELASEVAHCGVADPCDNKRDEVSDWVDAEIEAERECREESRRIAEGAATMLQGHVEHVRQAVRRSAIDPETVRNSRSDPNQL